jgi:hypothetical protein
MFVTTHTQRIATHSEPSSRRSRRRSRSTHYPSKREGGYTPPQRSPTTASQKERLFEGGSRKRVNPKSEPKE